MNKYNFKVGDKVIVNIEKAHKKLDYDVYYGEIYKKYKNKTLIIKNVYKNQVDLCGSNNTGGTWDKEYIIKHKPKSHLNIINYEFLNDK